MEESENINTQNNKNNIILKLFPILTLILMFIIVCKIISERASNKSPNQCSLEHLSMRSNLKLRLRKQMKERVSNKNLIGGTHEKIVFLRNVYDLQIVPTLQEFIKDFQNDQQVRLRFKLSKSKTICEDEYRDVLLFINNILQKLESKNIHENYRPPVGETSYTMDKQNMYLCIRDQNEQTHNDDILLFVFVHEIAHVGNSTKGHDNLFWSNFRLLLDILCNYEPKNVKKIFPRIKYCKIDLGEQPFYNYCNKQEITYNPLNDKEAFLTY